MFENPRVRSALAEAMEHNYVLRDVGYISSSGDNRSSEILKYRLNLNRRGRAHWQRQYIPANLWPRVLVPMTKTRSIEDLSCIFHLLQTIPDLASHRQRRGGGCDADN